MCVCVSRIGQALFFAKIPSSISKINSVAIKICSKFLFCKPMFIIEDGYIACVHNKILVACY